jgi:hypothetical protein
MSIIENSNLYKLLDTTPTEMLLESISFETKTNKINANTLKIVYVIKIEFLDNDKSLDMKFNSLLSEATFEQVANKLSAESTIVIKEMIESLTFIKPQTIITDADTIIFGLCVASIMKLSKFSNNSFFQVSTIAKLIKYTYLNKCYNAFSIVKTHSKILRETICLPEKLPTKQKPTKQKFTKPLPKMNKTKLQPIKPIIKSDSTDWADQVDSD